MGKKAQRWGILIIAVVTVIGTIGSFGVMVLAQQDSSKMQRELSDAQSKYSAAQKVYQANLDQELNQKYYQQVIGYKSLVGKFPIDSVKKLNIETIEPGSGDPLDQNATFEVYYIGWDANGNIFDSSINDVAGELKAPFSIDGGLSQASVIKGWKDGLKDVKVNEVRLLTIPSDDAYGEQGSQAIAPNMPLKFVVLVVEDPVDVPGKQAMNDALNNYFNIYTKVNGGN